MAFISDRCLGCRCSFVRLCHLLFYCCVLCLSPLFPSSFFIAVTTLFLTIPPPPHNPFPVEDVDAWATVLGVTASVLAAIQYVPQLLHTYQSKLVGTLGIPMMAIQTPGGLFIVASILFRPGIKWTGTPTIFFPHCRYC
jgi:uncharacterized protein with PQ loop repeat